MLLFLSSLLYWWHYNPWPSDEEMITRFHEHRAEIDELVKRYRGWKPMAGQPIWENLSDNKSLMAKAGISRIIATPLVWPPNPYSKEAVKQFEDALLAGKIPNLNYYASILIELLDENNSDRSPAWVLTSSGSRVIFKRLIFMPGDVYIEDGQLWFPAHPFFGVNFKERILPSLDTYPPNWNKSQCVYRQIEAHWFISMCTAA